MVVERIVPLAYSSVSWKPCARRPPWVGSVCFRPAQSILEGSRGRTVQATPSLPRADQERGNCHPGNFCPGVGALALRPDWLLRPVGIVPFLSLTLPAGRR
jgi:hypothetical protein